ncbi:hypothetical protein GCM10010123_29340 [Pilimelia anulata]|uniref:SAM-dependent MidA family methyltransferase n=1 Tax=Pilimelia anulata TaxID=53371 RepID=A0A8J3FAJ0_9ACTN|nr:SAM-dependent methyltransferase [Pilimelia anulata]GGJ97439.1 hypothetical protein GCM10010123_29340 [Pilimelia anulata]
MERALYGPAGFFRRGAPADHFRTSAHASPLFAGALARLVATVDAALGRPDPLDLVDVGAGRGELLLALAAALPAGVRARLRAVAVEVAPRPAGLPAWLDWRAAAPDAVTGVLLATEWLDNVPLDLARAGRYVTVDAAGREGRGGPLAAADAAWCARWWPGPGPAEIGRSRDAAWAGAVARLRRGVALAVDYGHTLADRPAGGSLVGYRGGRRVPPVPDGRTDLTAHVALDSAAAAAGAPYRLVRQRDALRALGVDGGRPPLESAHRDPAAYLRALAAAGAAGELLDPGGLGGHWFLLHPRGLGDLDPLAAGPG